MTVMVIFQQPENPYVLGRLPMPDYDTAAWYVMHHLSGPSQSGAIIEDDTGHRSMQPHIRMHYDRLRWTGAVRSQAVISTDPPPAVSESHR